MKKRQLCLTVYVCMLLVCFAPHNTMAFAENDYTTDLNSSNEERGHPNAATLLVTCPPAGPLFFTSCDVTGLAAPTSDCTINSQSWTLVIFPSMPTGTTPTDPNGSYEVGTYQLVWTTDDCNGTVMCTVDFMVFDQTTPILTCPLILAVNCPGDVPQPVSNISEFLASGGTASDDCSDVGDLILINTTDSPTPDPNDCPASIVRSYTFEDEGGNSSTCVQNIIVTDNIPPTFTVPADITIFTDPDPLNNCAFSANIGITGDVLDEFENCNANAGEAVFTDMININGCTPGSGSNVHGTILREWTLTDECGNVTTQVQTITIVDNTPPSFTAPIDVTISTNQDVTMGCMYDADPTNTGEATNQIDNCTANIEANFVDVITNNVPCVGSFVITRTWSMVDDCGNAAPDQIQTITVTDDVSPIFTVPADITIFTDNLCNFDSSVGQTGDVTDELDNCDMTVDATFSDAIMVGVPCVGGRIITRTWSLMDDCGNMAMDQIQTITVTDNIAPVFTAPADITLFTDATCMYDDSVSNTGDVTDEDDNCTTNGLEATFSDALSTDDPCTGSAVIMRTWSLMDDCGNMAADQIQTITITDNIIPTFTAPADITIFTDATCMYDESVSNTGDVTDEMDNCDSAVDATFSDFLSPNNPCTGSAVITRTWSLMDACGNMAADQIQTITVSDNMVPTFTAPADLTITCIQDFNDLTLTGDVTDEADNCSTGIDATFVDSIIPGTCDGEFTVERTWTLIDDCANVAAMQAQYIFVEDLIEPVVTCGDITMNSDPGVCEAFVTVPAPGVTEACSSFTVLNDYNNTSDATDTYPVGTTIVLWTVTDDCGNIGTCSFTITVIDNENPIVIGDNNIQVAIGGAGTAELTVADVLISATDNCEVDTVEIRRIETNGGPCNTVDNDVFGDTVYFCCADVNTIVAVQIRAIDIYGNSSIVMIMIPVEDNIAPTTTCPSDVTVNCEFQLDYNDLSNVGVIVQSPNVPNDIIIDGIVVGVDGVADDNCDDLTITESVDDSNLECNQGVITRTFTITDIGGNTTTCTQNITIQDDDPFDVDDIVFPADFNITDCMAIDIDPSITGEPFYLTDKCNIVGQSYSDAPFQNPNSGCPFFIRTWTIIDWCQYQSNTPGTPGIWTMDQNISVINSIAPTFAACNDTIVCADELTCNGELFFTMIAEDDCTAEADLQWTYSLNLFGLGSTFINGNVNTIVGTFPPGDHIVTWTVEDRCGNESTCVQNMTIKDCKAPTVVCINGLAIGLQPQNGGGASVEIWASDFDQSTSDNCTPTSEIQLSFSSDPTDQFRQYTCADVGEQNVEVWATDNAGNQSFCNTYVIIQDNHGVCPPPGMVRVGGHTMSESGEGIENVEVSITSDNMNDMHMSSDLGVFEFDNVATYDNYVIHPSLDVEHMNGVSTLDLVLIQKHILGIEKLNSPYKLIAADVNNNSGLSGTDLVELRKLILGIFTEFPHNTSWRFVPEALVFPDPTYPWNYEELIELQNIDQNEMGVDFIGVKIGDVNDSAIPNDFGGDVENRTDNTVTFEMENQHYFKGEKVSIPMRASNFEEIVALQFTMDYDERTLQYTGIVPGVLNVYESNVAIPKTDQDVLTFSWHDVSPYTAGVDDILFTLEFVARQGSSIQENLYITSSITEAAAFTNEYEKLNVENRFDVEIDQIQVYQNNPNPFNYQTTITIDLPIQDQTRIQVFDSKGSTVYSQQSIMKKGRNELSITSDDLGNQPGIYYYEVSTTTTKVTKRMVLLK